MKVKELIEVLSACHPELDVVFVRKNSHWPFAHTIAMGVELAGLARDEDGMVYLMEDEKGFRGLSERESGLLKVFRGEE